MTRRRRGSLNGFGASRRFPAWRCWHIAFSGRAKKGLSVDDEKQQKARRREFSRFEESLPERVPHLLEKGCDKVAYDLLKQLADGSRRPAELRTALGIASANFFTARYLTPLVKAGYISIENPASIHSPLQRYRLIAKGRRMVR